MEINGLKVLEGRLKNINIKDFLNPKFTELLEKELDDMNIIHLGIVTGTGKDQQLISFSHARPEHAKENELTINVSKEEQMDQIISVINQLNKGE